MTLFLSFIQHFNARIHLCNRSNFGVFHIFLYWNLVDGSLRQKIQIIQVLPVASSLVASMHLSRSIILKFWSWRSHRKFMEDILKFSGYTLFSSSNVAYEESLYIRSHLPPTPLLGQTGSALPLTPSPFWGKLGCFLSLCLMSPCFCFYSFRMY